MTMFWSAICIKHTGQANNNSKTKKSVAQTHPNLYGTNERWICKNIQWNLFSPALQCKYQSKPTGYSPVCLHIHSLCNSTQHNLIPLEFFALLNWLELYLSRIIVWPVTVRFHCRQRQARREAYRIQENTYTHTWQAHFSMAINVSYPLGDARSFINVCQFAGMAQATISIHIHHWNLQSPIVLNAWRGHTYIIIIIVIVIICYTEYISAGIYMVEIGHKLNEHAYMHV